MRLSTESLYLHPVGPQVSWLWVIPIAEKFNFPVVPWCAIWIPINLQHSDVLPFWGTLESLTSVVQGKFCVRASRSCLQLSGKRKQLQQGREDIRLQELQVKRSSALLDCRGQHQSRVSEATGRAAE